MSEMNKIERPYEDGSWHWVRYEGLHEVYKAPAMYKANCDAWYSFQFSGIPTRQVEVLGPCVNANLPVGVPDAALVPSPSACGDAWTNSKPEREGAYWLRGNGLEQPALIQVKMGPDQLECNLHMSTTQPDFGYGYTIAQLSDDFEWLGPLTTAAPTIKAEQVPTPEFVWVRLLEAMAGDNGCPFAASTDDYREAKPALVQLIAAGFFRNDADSLDGDVWTVAAGEQSEAAERFAKCADAYAVLSDVLNRVFERGDQEYDHGAERLTAEALGTGAGINMAATSIDELFDEPVPSLPAAGSTGVEALESWVKFADALGLELRMSDELWENARNLYYQLRAALSAQQSAPERVSVPQSWRVVEKPTCFALLDGNQVIATLAGPDAEENAAIIAALLNGGGV